MAFNVMQKVKVHYLKDTKYEKLYWTLSHLPSMPSTYNGLCSLCYTTNLLKDGGFTCISSSNDKSAKMWASVLHSKGFDISLELTTFDLLDGHSSAISAMLCQRSKVEMSVASWRD